MTTELKTTDIEQIVAITSRTIDTDRTVASVDVDLVTGEILVTEPFNANGRPGGRLVIYPAAAGLEINEPVIVSTFEQTREFFSRTLYYPRDAKFDYARKKIWIADTGNNRVMKINRNDLKMEVIVEDSIIYPYALAVDLNTGGVLVRGYADRYDNETVFYLNSDGSEIARFSFGHSRLDSSSSSISSSSSSSS